ncbi:hypothetical protein TRFO_22120 [Tritrichomonas foetus]|uniref:Uncharacterized protein n=1 Tax=Tritrichomonas foetus TaxID=1144522 RepID=A0A1J4KHI0_9EUKA|nr:hypothetical protein TRFO_22120 [Tritrichomonas foetus]|eukprot:OHT09118.1 hypothetical protein TRFO_22120 [Tritrichomonas foetus]
MQDALANINREIQIFLHDEENNEIPLTVRALDSISSLFSNLAACSKSRFFYGDKFLQTAFTFAFYGISEGDHIYSVKEAPSEPQNPQISHLEKFINFKKKIFNFCPRKNLSQADMERFRKQFEKIHGRSYEEELFEQNYLSYVDPEIALETAKLKDKFYSRIEGTIKCHRKLVKSFLSKSAKLCPCCRRTNSKSTQPSEETNNEDTDVVKE